MVKKTLFGGIALFALMGLSISCMDDLELDKITEHVNADMAVLFPVATADLTLEDMLELASDSCIEYYNTDKAKDILKFKGGKEDLFKATALSLLDLEDNTLTFRTKAIDMAALNDKGIKGEISNTIPVEIPVQIDYYDIRNVKCDIAVKMKYGAFGESAVVSLKLDQEKQVTLSIPGDGKSGEKTAKAKGVSLDIIKGMASADMIINTKVGAGALSTIAYEITIDSIKSIEVAMIPMTLKVKTHKLKTGMHGLKRMSGSMHFLEPSISLFVTNGCDLDLELTPTIKVSDIDTYVFLEPKSHQIKASSGKNTIIYTNEDSNVIEMFDLIPDYMEVEAEVGIRMPEGKETIVLNSTDEIGFGYKYEIPGHVRFDGGVKADTMDISSIDEIDKVEKGRVIFNVTNSFPFGAALQVDFINNKTHRVFGDPIVIEEVVKADLNENGIIEKPQVKDNMVDLTATQIQQLKHTEALLISMDLSSKGKDGQDKVWLQKQNHMFLEFALAGKLKMD